MHKNVFLSKVAMLQSKFSLVKICSYNVYSMMVPYNQILQPRNLWFWPKKAILYVDTALHGCGYPNIDICAILVLLA